MKKFSIIITTKDRIKDLSLTLNKIKHLFDRVDVECIICDDGSNDGTSKYINEHWPNILLIQHQKSIGLIACRNKLLNLTKAKYAITLDDDAHFIIENPLGIIESYFNSNLRCGALAFRLYWGKLPPKSTDSNDISERVRSFVGCGHVWNMVAWKSIPNYPEWFVFYGEEEFASYQLFKNNWEIHYLPAVLVNHRVNIKERKKNKDYRIRLRRSLRSGWYLYFLFYPYNTIPRRFFYTLWIQIKTKVFKGDFKALMAILQALADVVINFPRLNKNANRLSKKEFTEYLKLEETKLYWTPKDELV
ncbi:glycosyltransferase family 2 protein [Changchengzhania lutea]|uniref:glycosyltransferase family 2 protein n=1 Tax=Changchengzhania lutea TaxID=2049305 RepID=UPI00115CB44A|nr:glycosyltransferase family 2 protein [Changchengzhania lutea]